MKPIEQESLAAKSGLATGFQRVQFFDGRMQMEIPNGWEDMPLARVETIFTMDEKPQVVKSSQDGTRFITLSLSDKPLSGLMVRTATRMIASTIENVYPFIAPVKIRSGVRKEQLSRYGWFAFRMPASKGEIATIMFVTSLNGRLLLGSCGYPPDDTEAETLFQDCIASILDIRADFKE